MNACQSKAGGNKCCGTCLQPTPEFRIWLANAHGIEWRLQRLLITQDVSLSVAEPVRARGGEGRQSHQMETKNELEQGTF